MIYDAIKQNLKGLRWIEKIIASVLFVIILCCLARIWLYVPYCPRGTEDRDAFEMWRGLVTVSFVLSLASWFGLHVPKRK